MADLSAWNPPPNTTDHAGQPLFIQNKCFFIAPPPEIGEVKSAFSEMEAGFQDPDRGKKIRSAVMGGVYMVILGLLLNVLFFRGASLAIYLTLAVVVPLGAYFGYVSSVGMFDCHYVGKEGVARYKYEKSPKLLQPDQTRLRFADAAELRTKVTRKITNGIYQNTSYDFDWNDATGQKIYSIFGVFISKQNTPPPEDRYYFALASEVAWTDYLMEKTKEDRQFGNPIRFNLTNGNYLMVSSKQMELVFKGEKTVCTADEIEAVEVKKGVVSVRRKDARSGFLGIGGSGTFRFDYADLANAKFCFAMLDSLFGVETSEESDDE